jgi:hypothetical protein
MKAATDNDNSDNDNITVNLSLYLGPTSQMQWIILHN